MNELTIKDFSVSFQVPEITVAHEDELANTIKQYANKYDGLVVTEETLADSKKVRAELNKLSKAINDRRKEIKRNYDQPLKEFEAKVKQWDSDLHHVMDGLDAGIHEMQEREVVQRTKKVQETIAEMAPNYGVDVSEIELRTNWLTKSISKKKLINEIAGEMKFVKEHHEKMAMIQKYCDGKEISFEPYRRLAETFEPLEVMKQIDDDLEAQAKREEAQKAAKQAKLERQKENTVEVNGRAFDKETGETIKEEQRVTLTLQGNESEINGLAYYIKAMGLKVIGKCERETVIVRG